MERDQSQPLPQQRSCEPPDHPGTNVYHLDSGIQLRERSPKITSSGGGDFKPVPATVNRQAEQRKHTSTHWHWVHTSAADYALQLSDSTMENGYLSQFTPGSWSTPQEGLTDLSPPVWSAMASPASTAMSSSPLQSRRGPAKVEENASNVSTGQVLDWRSIDHDLVEVGAIFERLCAQEHELRLQLNDYRLSAIEMTDGSRWDSILATNKSLLNQYCDFLQVSEDLNSPKGIKYLAARYTMPARMCKNGFRNTVNVLRQRLPYSDANMQNMAHLAFETLQKLAVDVPDVQSHWRLIHQHLRNYFDALREDGFDITVPSADGSSWAIPQASKEQDLKSENMWRKTFQSTVVHGVSPYKECLAQGRICDSARLLMSGWLCLGRHFAGCTFDSYCKVFNFLGLVGADAFDVE